MTDVLVYSKNYEASHEPHYWHSNASVFGSLIVGDRLWVVTSGKPIACEPATAAFLVAVWSVSEVIENPDDDPKFPARKFAHRVVASDTDSVTFHDPVDVDNLIRPDEADKETSIGRFLRMPRRLDESQLRQLKAAAGSEIALRWLTGKPKS
jgi:hypothetical protein